MTLFIMRDEMVVTFVLIFFAEAENATIQWILYFVTSSFFNRRPKETNISFSGVSRHGPNLGL